MRKVVQEFTNQYQQALDHVQYRIDTLETAGFPPLAIDVDEETYALLHKALCKRYGLPPAVGSHLVVGGVPIVRVRRPK